MIEPFAPPAPLDERVCLKLSVCPDRRTKGVYIGGRNLDNAGRILSKSRSPMAKL